MLILSLSLCISVTDTNRTSLFPITLPKQTLPTHRHNQVQSPFSLTCALSLSHDITHSNNHLSSHFTITILTVLPKLEPISKHKLKAVVVAQLVERSLPKTMILGSNPAIGNIIRYQLYLKHASSISHPYTPYTISFFFLYLSHTLVHPNWHIHSFNSTINSA